MERAEDRPVGDAGGSTVDALRMLRSLRATRAFESTPPTAAVLGEILEVARWTGSARNRQPWRIALVDRAEDRRALAALGAYAAVLAAAPLAVVLAVDHRLGGADAEFDAGRFAQGLMLAGHVLGVASCPVSFFPPANALRATDLIGLEAPWTARTAIALGYPAVSGADASRRSAIPTGRRPIGELIVGRPEGRHSSRSADGGRYVQCGPRDERADLGPRR